MNIVAVAFWGAFFGSVVLMLAGSLVAYALSLQRVALRAGLTAALSGLFAVAFIGWLPIDNPGVEQRVQAHIAALCSVLLGLMLLALFGLMREPDHRRRVLAMVFGMAALVVGVGWVMQPMQSLAVACVGALLVAFVALVVCVRAALRGDLLAWLALSGVIFLMLSLASLSWIALDRVTAWPLHVFGALCGMAYLGSFSAALWARYSYLIELREVMSHGPSYDPVTRMRSHAETGQLVGSVFQDIDGQPQPVGVIAISIGNLYALEQLHGRGAANHALYVCASRLRRAVPAEVEMGRLADDGFLLLTRKAVDSGRLVALARQVASRLAQPVSLNTSDPTEPEGKRASWVADVGVGVLAAATPMVRASTAVSMARAMSRTAWSFASRVAWFDRETRQISELPLTDGPVR